MSERQYEQKIELDWVDPESNFGLVVRLVGKGGRNVKHIGSATGSYAWVRGRGSRSKDGPDEPLHFLVKSSDQDSLHEAVNLANDLIDRVKQSGQCKGRSPAADFSRR